MYFRFFFTILFLSIACTAEAHVPNLVTQETLHDLVVIDDPILSQAFYGTLNDIPHTYVVQSDTSFTLTLAILVPDIESSTNTISGIIIKLPETSGRVTEIARLEAKDALWESEYEPFGGDTYRNGPTFEKELDPGTYHVEIHTPDNREKYVLVVGTREDMTLGYFEMISRLIEVKRFFDKSAFRIVESPFIYVPSGILIGVLYFMYRRIKKRVHVDTV